MKHTPRYIEKCRRTERRGHGGDDDGGGAGRERDEVLQKVKDKERLLEGASHVSFERQRQRQEESRQQVDRCLQGDGTKDLLRPSCFPLSRVQTYVERKREREREREK